MIQDIGWSKIEGLNLSPLEYLHLVSNDDHIPAERRRDASGFIKSFFLNPIKKRSVRSFKPVTYEYQCKGCKKTFTGKIKAGPRKVYCSPQCQRKWVDKTCKQCGSIFSTQNDSSFCSSKCWGLFSKKKYAEENYYVCKKCGKKFFRKYRTGDEHRYCSRKCAGNGVPGRSSDPSRHKKGSHRRRAKIYNVDFETIDVLKVFERDMWRCQICGKKTPKEKRGTGYSNAPEIDHRVPMSKGGGHLYRNVQCACRKCNNVKSNKSNRGQLPLFDVER